MSKRISFPKIKLSQPMKIGIIIILIAAPVTIAVIAFLLFPMQQTTKPKLVKIPLIPDSFTDGDSIYDYGWDKYHAQNPVASFLHTSEGKILYLNNPNWELIDIRYNISETRDLNVSFKFHYNESQFSGEILVFRFFQNETIVYGFSLTLIANLANPYLDLNMTNGTITAYRNDALYSSESLDPDIEVNAVGIFIRNGKGKFYFTNLTATAII